MINIHDENTKKLLRVGVGNVCGRGIIMFSQVAEPYDYKIIDVVQVASEKGHYANMTKKELKSLIDKLQDFYEWMDD